MHIEAIPMRWGTGDNYAYLVVDDSTSTRDAWLIDPAQPDEVQQYFKTEKPEFNLKAIVNTHHHYDHSDGNEEFHNLFPNLPVIAGKDSPFVSYTPGHKEQMKLGNITITALHTPCHTQDSICYFALDNNTNKKAVFTGDTLFTSGCGRFFEGDGAQMNKALNGVLAKLPADTFVYPGHEYTKSNLKFSCKVLDNEAIRKLSDYTSKNEKTTGVFTIGDELKFNPFMMLEDEQVKKATGLTNSDEIMTRLREMKNRG